MKYVIAAFIIALSFSSYAQGVEIDYKTQLERKTYSIDTDAEAVVLFEKGNVNIVSPGGPFEQEYKIHRIIKILKNSAKDLGNVRELYFAGGFGMDKVVDVNGTTYNLSGDSVVKTPLKKKDVYDDRIYNHFRELKFSMPDVSAGSIIDYEYDIITPMHDVLPVWEFQSRVPKIISEYQVQAPTDFTFRAISQQRNDFKSYESIKAAERDGATSYKVAGRDKNQYILLWCRKHVEGLMEEPYINTIEDYCELLELQVSSASYKDGITSWPMFDKTLMRNEHFGLQLQKPHHFLNAVVDSLTQHDTTAVQKAQHIFSYVQTNFTCNNFDEVLAGNDLSEVFSLKRGSDAEINLLLAAMLKKSDLDASPLVLSKTGHKKIFEDFPVLDRMDYIATVVTIDSIPYLLDATDKFNKFGTLPLYCYNGYARLVDNEGSLLYLSANDVMEREYRKISISNITDSSMVIDVKVRPGTVDARLFRIKFANDSSMLKDWINEQAKSLQGEVTIISSHVENANDPERILSINYSLNIKNNNQGNNIYIPTDFTKVFKVNPFKAEHRKLPIEFRARREFAAAFEVHMPPLWEPEEMPTNSIYTSADGNMSFKHFINYDASSHTLSANSLFSNTQASYEVGSYPDIKAFFEKVVNDENSVFVIKKKNR